MTWPTGSITTTNTDAGTDSPASARADLLAMEQVVNQIIANGEPMTLAGTQTIAGAKTFSTPPGGVPGRVIGYNYIDSTGGATAGTYTPPAGYSWVEVELQGPGGGGAGAATTTNAQAGGGGGSGGYLRFVMTAAQLGSSIAFSLAAGGTAGAAGGAGGNASNSTFGTWVAQGGQGAPAPGAESTAGVAIGGARGFANAGTGTVLMAVDGVSGCPGTWTGATSSDGGDGGNSFLGQGAKAGKKVVGATGVAAGRGIGYGYGGGGGGTWGASGSSVGSAGGASFLRVTAYSS